MSLSVRLLCNWCTLARPLHTALAPSLRANLSRSDQSEIFYVRKYHEKYGRHHYFLSWREPWNKFEDWDWFNARNFCRERCMDLVSFEDPEEYRHFAKMLHRGRFNEILNKD